MKSLLKLIYIATFVLTLNSAWAHIPAESITEAQCDQACRAIRNERIERIRTSRDGKVIALRVDESKGDLNLENKKFEIKQRMSPNNYPDISISIDGRDLPFFHHKKTYLGDGGSDVEVVKYYYIDQIACVHQLKLDIKKSKNDQPDTFTYELTHFYGKCTKHLNHASGSGTRN